MNNSKFEGEVDGLSDKHLNFVASVLKERGYSDGKIVVSSVGKVDDNFVATIKRFVFEKDGKSFSMVAKVAPMSEAVRSKMNSGHLFVNEHVMYTEVFPEFTELEKGADIPESERFRYAKCYGSLSEEPNEIILLEDLQLSNFALLDKHEYYTDETVKLVLKNYAILHSLSFVLKNREPATYEDFKKKLNFNWGLLLETEGFQKVFGQLEDRFIPLLDNAKHKKVVTGVTKRLPEFVMKNYKIDKDSKYSVIQQGDCWNNNMMFVVKEGKVVQCCLIDYQIASNNSPAVDLHYMIFACTDYETRSKHYHEWIDCYHAQLDASLGNFGLKASSVYPRDQLDADLKRLAKIGFGLAMMMSNIELMDTELAAKMKETMKVEGKGLEDVYNFTGGQSNSPSAKKYKARVLGVVKSFIELGYL